MPASRGANAASPIEAPPPRCKLVTLPLPHGRDVLYSGRSDTAAACPAESQPPRGELAKLPQPRGVADEMHSWRRHRAASRTLGGFLENILTFLQDMVVSYKTRWFPTRNRLSERLHRLVLHPVCTASFGIHSVTLLNGTFIRRSLRALHESFS